MSTSLIVAELGNDFCKNILLELTNETVKMDIDLASLKPEDLNLLLIKAEKELQVALLNGVSWKESKDLRDDITEIQIAIYRAKFPHNSSDIDQIMRRLMHSPDLSA